jgi:hypothetical protein
MQDIHSLNHLPSQYAIDSIANYQSELKNDYLSYMQLLEKIKKDIHKLGFTPEDDNQMWMLRRGNDYLTNPKLFKHAPLSYICILLCEVFKEDNLDELAMKLPAPILNQLLTRFNAFKLH